MPMSGLVRRMRDEVKDYVEYMEHIWIGKKVPWPPQSSLPCPTVEQVDRGLS